MNELSKSISDLINTINNNTNNISEAFEKYTPELWKLTVYQVKLHAYVDMIGCLCCTAFCLFVYKLIQNKFKDSKDPAYYIGLIIFGFIAFFLFMIGIFGNIETLLNPEYAAASELAKRFLGR